MASDKERIAAHKFLDANILGFDEAIRHKELRDLTLWCEDGLCNGAALHIIIEDGNYDDCCVDWCLYFIESGDWSEVCKKEDYSYTDEDNGKMLRVLELMKPLTEEQREMVMEGKTITEDLFDILYNKALN